MSEHWIGAPRPTDHGWSEEPEERPACEEQRLMFRILLAVVILVFVLSFLVNHQPAPEPVCVPAPERSVG